MGKGPEPITVMVATHGHCFDGAASAAAFTCFLSLLDPRTLTFSYRACGYYPSSRPLGPTVLRCDVNAILDYQYSTHPNLHWYFDHHPTAFLNSAQRNHFNQHRNQRHFHDPSYGSCTRLIVDVAHERFGIDMPHLQPLVRWAEIIDAANFDSPEEAVACEHPVLQLMTVIEHQGNTSTLNRIVPLLAERHVEQVAREPEIQRSWKRLEPYHRTFMEKVRERSRPLGSVVYVDLSDEVFEVVGKFITYALFPSSLYSVILTRGKAKLKLSVGFNPWAQRPRRHDIGAICSRNGGGGHAFVGAIALPVTDLEKARSLALEIVQELEV